MNKRFLAFLTSFFILISAFFGISPAIAAGNTKIVYAYMDECRMCRVFEMKVLQDPEVQDELSNFNFQKINALSGKIHVKVTPTIIVYRNNKQIRKFVPSIDKDKFLAFLKALE